MERRKFIVASAALAAALGCSNDPQIDKRAKRYDEKECPFCTPKPGECYYCHGSGKCEYCNGTGKRITSTKGYPYDDAKKVEYEEECPFCKGTGECKYCDGTGKCWPCHGTGKIESWEFYEQYKKNKKD